MAQRALNAKTLAHELQHRGDVVCFDDKLVVVAKGEKKDPA